MLRSPQSTKWLETIDAFIAGELDAAASHEFQEQLRNDEQARLVYVEYLDLHFELLQGAGRLADAESVARKARAPHYGRLAAAGVAAALFGLVAWGLWRQADQRQVAIDAEPAIIPIAAAPTVEASPELAPPPPFVARLVRTVEAEWTDSNLIPGEGDRLRVGDVLDLTTGAVEIQFESGARACLTASDRNAARLRLTSSNACQFESGHATFSVPEGAQGFTVETFGGRYVDHGTEFGVAVDPRGPSEVHVLKGRVEAISRQSSQTMMLEKGSAAALDGLGQAVAPVKFNPAGFLRPATLSWGVDRYSESIQPHLIPPSSLHREANLAETAAHLVLEKRTLRLRDGWQNSTQNTFEVGNSGSRAVESFSLAAGTRVDAYLFHASPTTEGGRRDVKGELRFRRPILAVITETDDLRRGRELFDVEGVQYTNDAGFGLETIVGAAANDRVDVVELTEDRRGLRFVLNLGNAIDEFRVLVAAEDAPAGTPVVSAEENR